MPTTHPLQLGGRRRRFHLLQTTAGSSRPRGVQPGWPRRSLRPTKL